MLYQLNDSGLTSFLVAYYWLIHGVIPDIIIGSTPNCAMMDPLRHQLTQRQRRGWESRGKPMLAMTKIW